MVCRTINYNVRSETAPVVRNDWMSGMAPMSSRLAKQKPFSRPNLRSGGGDRLVDPPKPLRKA